MNRRKITNGRISSVPDFAMWFATNEDNLWELWHASGACYELDNNYEDFIENEYWRTMKTIRVLSRKAAQEYECDKSWACISVCCPDDSHPKISKVKQVDLLQLMFWDRDFPRSTDDPQYVFNEDHAEQVWDFVEKNWDRIDELMVHCLMGQSRSAGIAAAISKVKTGDDQVYFGAYTPNMLIYRKLFDEAHKRGIVG